MNHWMLSFANQRGLGETLEKALPGLKNVVSLRHTGDSN